MQRRASESRNRVLAVICSFGCESAGQASRAAETLPSKTQEAQDRFASFFSTRPILRPRPPRQPDQAFAQAFSNLYNLYNNELPPPIHALYPRRAFIYLTRGQPPSTPPFPSQPLTFTCLISASVAPASPPLHRLSIRPFILPSSRLFIINLPSAVAIFRFKA
jgi:hypothetical protein